MLPGQFAGVMVTGGVRAEVVAVITSSPAASIATSEFVFLTDPTNWMVVLLVGGVRPCWTLLQVAITSRPAEFATYTNGPDGSWVTSVLEPPIFVVTVVSTV